jgi:anti-sigma regulatory factor (Ser/Thr protein kinase)
VSSLIEELTIAASAEESRRASDWLVANCRQGRVPEAEIDQLALCLEEVLANVIAHGGPTAHSQPIRLRFDVATDRASVTVLDAGKAFDPLSAPRKPLPKTLEEAVAGGRGLEIIRHCSDLHYRREEGRNHLTFGMRWSP